MGPENIQNLKEDKNWTLAITERFLGKLEEEEPVKVTEKAGGQGGRSRRAWCCISVGTP